MRTLKYFLIGFLGVPTIILVTQGALIAVDYAVENFIWWPGSGTWIVLCMSMFAGGMAVIAGTFLTED